MIKLDIYGGLLGAGKTTLIKAMLNCAYLEKRVAVIENEVGRVNLDVGEFTGITVRPLTAGCVCCTLKGDLVAAVRELVRTEAPDYIVMEASGAADLDAIRRICEEIDEVSLNRCVMVVNARKLRKLMTVVGEFYRIQLREAAQIYLNFTEGLPQEELTGVRRILQQVNPNARLIDTPIASLRADSFPEGVAAHAIPEADRESGPVRPKLTVMDQAQAFRILPTDRLAHTSARSAFQGGLRSGSRLLDSGKTLYTIALKVPAPLTQQELDFFREQLEENGIWRAKGFVTMTDGSIKKIDYAFGDFFIAIKSPDTAAASDEIVLIGEDPKALSEKDLMGRFFGKQPTA